MYLETKNPVQSCSHSSPIEVLNSNEKLFQVYYRWGYGIVESLLAPMLETFELLSHPQRRQFLAEIILTQSQLLDGYLQRLPCYCFVILLLS